MKIYVQYNPMNQVFAVVDVNVIFLTQKMQFAYTFLHFPCKPLSNSMLCDV